jgi:hypothetical protein
VGSVVVVVLVDVDDVELVDVLLTVVVELVLELVVVLACPGAPSWQWFVSPPPKPGWHATDVLVVSCGLPCTPGPPEIAHADPPENTAAAAIPANSLSARSLPTIPSPSAIPVPVNAYVI